ncbi:tetratricopeptide repeat-containing sulfotransferase family protein [Pseudemcibacter aquimaris]|uniref:tetratricopeptide repeat-containing sulfotransferase family protein n=1 Tax=Pseudemcibacter aquimaris TaxID=2857064 RepID=UPI002011DC7E|nr:tetratricopeptide repeat-containing sulfotransferase family protein [Pseudemcibacter aquimaris]MCC3862472.1 tetratricopeptide repeat protein [Pseudemcibacter aquimaris]WDU59100.1 tetratricopeptide repeat protein [Pseudemcibacter aquimaris]
MTQGKWQAPPANKPTVPTPGPSKQISLEQAMQHASQLQTQGQLQQAEQMLNKILAASPGYPPAFNLLGVIAHQVGKTEMATELLGKAIEGDNKNALFHSNRGEMFRQIGKLDEAIHHGKQAIKIAPKLASAQGNLGIAYFDQKNYEKAELHQKKALTIDPKQLSSLNNRGSIYKEQKDLENAEIWYKKALEIDPNYLESLNNLGTTLVDNNRAEEALPYLEKAVNLSPNYVEALNNLGRAWLQQDEFDKALPAFQKAAKLDNNHCSAHMGIAAIMLEKQNYDVAKVATERAINAEDDRAEAHTMLGRVFVNLGEEEKAHECYDNANKINPELGSAYNARGSLLLDQGKMSEAEENFRKGMALETEDGAKLESLFNLVSAIKMKEGSEEYLALMEAEKEIDDLSDKKTMLLHYALGKTNDDLKNYETAFEHYLKACALKRETFEYSSEEMTMTYKKTAEVFTPEFLESLKQYADPSAKPIFVLGSPRSGTTLTEQIISSHPDVFGAGELKDFSGSLESIPNFEGTDRYPNIMTSLTPEQLSHIPVEYVKRITAHAPDAKFITDKMPANYFYVGLIHTLLPNAKIVHVKRNALDTCISCFQRLFGHNQYQTYDLTELGTYYRNYVELMDHWRTVLPEGSFYELCYEELVSNPEEQSKALIAHCGLDWHEDCLNFHKNKRSIRTASVTQVRKPIYKSSMEKWRRYEKYLGPLIKALGHASPV